MHINVTSRPQTECRCGNLCGVDERQRAGNDLHRARIAAATEIRLRQDAGLKIRRCPVDRHCARSAQRDIAGVARPGGQADDFAIGQDGQRTGGDRHIGGSPPPGCDRADSSQRFGVGGAVDQDSIGADRDRSAIPCALSDACQLGAVRQGQLAGGRGDRARASRAGAAGQHQAGIGGDHAGRSG